jgi:hypothetical protein
VSSSLETVWVKKASVLGKLSLNVRRFESVPLYTSQSNPASTHTCQCLSNETTEGEGKSGHRGRRSQGEELSGP